MRRPDQQKLILVFATILYFVLLILGGLSPRMEAAQQVDVQKLQTLIDQVTSAMQQMKQAITPTALSVTCPVITPITASAPIAVSYSVPAAVGGQPPVVTTCTPAAGTAFPVGITTVTCSAKDAASVTAACSFPVTVTAPPTPTATIRVVAGGNLQAALDSATPGTTILVAPATFTGNFVLPKKAGVGVITIRTDGLDDTQIPPNVRIIPGNVSSRMAKLAVADSLSSTLSAADGACGYTMIGMEVLGNARNPDRDSTTIGRLDATSLAQVPCNITFDRMYIHGDPTAGGHRGINLNAINGVVSNSYISGYLESGRDSQAVLVVNTPGPIRLENNYLEGSGENFMVGGADPKIPNVVPSDIIFRGNYVFKPVAWKTKPGSVKNLFELKLGKRVLVENNVFENVWNDAQSGYAIQLTNRNQDGTAPWSTVQDVTIRYNVIKNATGPAFNMLGLDDRAGVPDVQGTNVVIENNLMVNVGNGFAINNGFQPTTIRHNTIVTLPYWFLNFSNNPIPSGLFTFQDNVMPSGQYGISANGPTIGAPSLQAGAPNAIFDHNVIEQPAGGSIGYPPGNTLITSGALTPRFDARKRYTGSELGHDNLKVGADIDGLIQRIPWATW